MNRKSLLKTVVAGLCLALAYVLPFITASNPRLGNVLCLMHIPVLICGFICGWEWGLGIGFVAPLFRSLTIGAPLLFPTAVCMALELATYGAIAGLMHRLLPKKMPFIYCSLIASMIIGRLVWGLSMLICMGIKGQSFTVETFLSGALITAIPGIIIQIALIPPLIMILESPKVLNLKE